MVVIAIIAVLSGLAFYQIYVGFMVRKHSPNWFVLVATLSLAVFMTQDYVRWVSMNSVGDGIVREVSGNSAGVLECKDWYSSLLMELGNYDGQVVSTRPEVASVTNNVCQNFRSWLERSNKENVPLVETAALATIIHEGVHVGGEFNEAVTDCVMLRLLGGVAVRHGASEVEASRMVAEYKRDWQPFKPSQYQGGVC